jgi:Uma2 family endonuclease
MNAPSRIETEPQRRLFTVDEVLAMLRAGVLQDDRKSVLIEGELIQLQSKLNPHELCKNRLAQAFHRLLPYTAEAWVEPTLYMPPFNAPDPDIMAFPRGRSIEELQPAEVCLVVEVAATTLRTDLGVKAAIYARHGVPEYWVIDVRGPRLIAHRGPDGDRWREIRTLGPDEPAAPLAFPDAAIRLVDLQN